MSDSKNASVEGVRSSKTLYSEQLWLPWYWWLLGFAFAGLTAASLARNRDMWWFIVPLIMMAVFIIWGFWQLSSTKIEVEEEADGSRWLIAGKANLPRDAVSKTFAVPASAKQNAMGRQLDPAAYVVHHGWVRKMAMFVLDDPEDPTPYWLVSTRDPDALLDAFLGPDRDS